MNTQKPKTAPTQIKFVYHFYFFILVFINIAFLGCTKESFKKDYSVNAYQKSSLRIHSSPNIILILADDVGYEVPTYTGGESYSTPNIDRLAQNSMQFTQCQSAPLCSPSRFMILTGKYNFRNYSIWGTLDTSQFTIANLLHDAGYATCVSGKWQLDGGDASIKKFGFDNYRVWLPFNPGSIDLETPEDWYRYKNPHLYENGEYMKDSATSGKYSDDLFVDYIKQFINNNSNKPFFVYYPLSLCHWPFTPTPDDPQYATWTPESHISKTTYFPSMVKYMDKKIGELLNYLYTKGLSSNTVVLFLSDNGTYKDITSIFQGKSVQGGKGTTTQYGTHVPFLVRWPGRIASGTVNNNIINFPDFMSLFASIAGVHLPTNKGIIDGVDFYPSFFTPADTLRQWGFCYFQAQTYSQLKRWSQTQNYKLYDSVNNSRFYNIAADTLEKYPISLSKATAAEKNIEQQLQDALNQMHN